MDATSSLVRKISVNMVSPIKVNFRLKYISLQDRLITEYNSKDPIELWESCLKKSHLIPGRKDYLLVNFITIFFLSLNAVRYLYLLSVIDHNKRIEFGSVFYPFGVGGVVIYMAAAMVSLECLLCRLLLLFKGWKEKKKGKLLFFFNIPNTDYLNSYHKASFMKRMKLTYYLVKVTFTATNYSSDIISLLSTIYCMIKEPLVSDKIIWMLWLVCQAFVTYTATHIFIILGLWFIQKEFLDFQVKQLIESVQKQEVKSSSQSKQSHKSIAKTAAPSMNSFDRLFATYIDIVNEIKKFNQMSKIIIFVLTFCSTAVNTSMIYGAMKTQQALFLFLSVILSVTSLYPLWVATSLSLKSRELYQHLNRRITVSFVSNNSSLKDLFLMREVLRNSKRTLSLQTSDGCLYEPHLFLEYVVSTVSMFLMLVQFLER